MIMVIVRLFFFKLYHYFIILYALNRYSNAIIYHFFRIINKLYIIEMTIPCRDVRNDMGTSGYLLTPNHFCRTFYINTRNSKRKSINTSLNKKMYLLKWFIIKKCHWTSNLKSKYYLKKHYVLIVKA